MAPICYDTAILSELQYNCNSSWVYLQLTSTYTALLTPSNSYKESFHSVVLDAMNRLSTYICWNTPSGQCCAVKIFLYSCGEPLFPRTFSLIHFSCLHSEWVKEAPALTVGEIARLVFIKHKYLLRVWVWSAFMKWWVTFPFCRLHSMLHCEKLLPQMWLSLLCDQRRAALAVQSSWGKTHHLHFYNSRIFSVLQNARTECNVISLSW